MHACVHVACMCVCTYANTHVCMCACMCACVSPTNQCCAKVAACRKIYSLRIQCVYCRNFFQVEVLPKRYWPPEARVGTRRPPPLPPSGPMSISVIVNATINSIATVTSCITSMSLLSR